MDRSMSEPGLSDADYHVVRMGHLPKTTMGSFAKDTGEYSSLINRIQKQAQKSPGPDKYQGHKEWAKRPGGNAFTKTQRFWKAMNAVPAPSNYEKGDIKELCSMKGRDTISTNRRVTQGKMATGKKRSFIDRSIAFSTTLPGPGNYTPKPHYCDKLDLQIPGSVSWQRQQATSKSRVPTVVNKVAPNTYMVVKEPTEERMPAYSVPKDLCQNFLDKAVKERYVDTKAKKELPGPGSYFKDSFNYNKISNGPIVKSTLSRAPMSSVF